MLVSALSSGKKILAFGNGGSAADSQHFAAELVNRFRSDRPALAAIALTTDTSILTSIANDSDYESVFSRQVEALGAPGDVAVAISTSGGSPNVLKAVEVARARGLKTIGLAGRDGGRLSKSVDLCLTVPHPETARIQEVHALLIHLFCEMIDGSLHPESRGR
jgi:D-sedoheptulose 7-phosphate isomerase